MLASIMKRAVIAVLCTAAIASSPAAMAEMMTFTAVWGPEFDEPSSIGSAVATFTIDTDWIPIGNVNKPPITIDRILNLSLTIQGASVGNGTYGASDFQGIVFMNWGPLDFSKELIGQTYTHTSITDKGGAFGESNTGWSGDFGLVGAVGSNFPTLYQPFEMLTNGDPWNVAPGATKPNDLLRVTSITAVPFASAVPEPSGIALLLTGLGFAGFMARRKR